jgi:hypothetical protein
LSKDRLKYAGHIPYVEQDAVLFTADIDLVVPALFAEHELVDAAVEGIPTRVSMTGAQAACAATRKVCGDRV